MPAPNADDTARQAGASAGTRGAAPWLLRKREHLQKGLTGVVRVDEAVVEQVEVVARDAAPRLPLERSFLDQVPVALRWARETKTDTGQDGVSSTEWRKEACKSGSAHAATQD